MVVDQCGAQAISRDIDISLHRHLTQDNINGIITISEAVLGKNYLIADDIVHPSYRWILATLDGTVVGFASFINDHTDSTITDVAVCPEHQGSGIATRLIAQCVFEIGTLWVETIECCAWMTNGYPHLEKPLLRNGFEAVGIEPRVPDDYRENFECPVCGIGCECNTMLYRKKAETADILNFDK